MVPYRRARGPLVGSRPPHNPSLAAAARAAFVGARAAGPRRAWLGGRAARRVPPRSARSSAPAPPPAAAGAAHRGSLTRSSSSAGPHRDREALHLARGGAGEDRSGRPRSGLVLQVGPRGWAASHLRSRDRCRRREKRRPPRSGRARRRRTRAPRAPRPCKFAAGRARPAVRTSSRSARAAPAHVVPHGSTRALPLH